MARDTRIILAAMEGSIGKVEALLAEGVEVDRPSRGCPIIPEVRGCTALMCAAWRGDLAMVEFLLAHGASPNARTAGERLGTFEDHTPLRFAIEGKNVAVVEKLIVAGADVTFNANWGETPLLSAVLKGSVEIAKLLIERGAPVNVHERKHPSILAHAVDLRDVEFVNYLLEKGVEPNGKDATGGTGLHHAVLWSEVGMVGALLKAGANPNASDREKRTPLFNAVAAFQREPAKGAECIQMLLAAGADSNAADGEGCTVLDQATSRYPKGIPGALKQMLEGMGAKGGKVTKGELPEAELVVPDFGERAGAEGFRKQLQEFAAKLNAKPEPMGVARSSGWEPLKGGYVLNGKATEIGALVEQFHVSLLAESVYVFSHVDARRRGRSQVQLGLLPTNDKFEVIAALVVGSANYDDADTATILQRLKEVEGIQPFHLPTAGMNQLELRFSGVISDFGGLAAALHELPAEAAAVGMEEYLNSVEMIEETLRREAKICVCWPE